MDGKKGENEKKKIKKKKVANLNTVKEMGGEGLFHNKKRGVKKKRGGGKLHLSREG